jgi:hypothetical protein
LELRSRSEAFVVAQLVDARGAAAEQGARLSTQLVETRDMIAQQLLPPSPYAREQYAQLILPSGDRYDGAVMRPNPFAVSACWDCSCPPWLSVHPRSGGDAKAAFSLRATHVASA